jgi:hypothetical protein
MNLGVVCATPRAMLGLFYHEDDQCQYKHLLFFSFPCGISVLIEEHRNSPKTISETRRQSRPASRLPTAL